VVGNVNKLCAHSVVVGKEPSHVPLGSSVNIITDQNVVTCFESVEEGGSRTTSTGKCNSCLTILEGSQAFFECLTSRVTSSCIVKGAVELSDVFLCESGAEVDGHIDTAMDGLGGLTSVDGKSRESGMGMRKIVFLCELLVLDFGFFFGVKHVDDKSITWGDLSIHINYSRL